MATGKASDFTIYEEQFYSGMWEGISQKAEGFNEASAGSIRLITNELLGNYEQRSFFKEVSNLITRRDTTSVSTATDLAMTMGELSSVKVHRKIGPIAQTLDAWRKVFKGGGDEARMREMSMQVGRQIGATSMKDMINTTLLAVEAALDGQAALEYDGTGDSPTTLTHKKLLQGQAKLGDYGDRVVCWVMHSAAYYDLMQQALSDNIYDVGSIVIKAGTTATLNRPTIVIDAPALTDANGSLPDSYNILGLVEGAVTCTQSEEQNLVTDTVTGLENLVYRIQGEYAYNLEVLGFTWDTSNGGANPTDAAIGTSSNWDLAVTSYKNAAGVRIAVL